MERDIIIEQYNDFILTNGKKPNNVYSFSKQIGIEEATFYKYFGSFEAIEKTIFTDLFNKTIEALNNNQDYLGYDAKTKLISFYFTFFENLTSNRSIVFQILKDSKWPSNSIKKLEDLRDCFKSYIKSLDIESIQIPQVKLEDIKNKTITELAWGQMLVTIKFWMEDESPSFEKTDIFIEKSLQASFDIVSLTPFKNILDLGKFLFKEKMGAK